jgi:uncharacterized membrane protein HdeD (DUF308 family)
MSASTAGGTVGRPVPGKHPAEPRPPRRAAWRAPNGGTVVADFSVGTDMPRQIFRCLYHHHYTAQRQPRWCKRCPLASNAAHTTCERKLQMSIKPDAAEGHTHVQSGAERALSRMAGPWWLFLVTGLAWLIIALVTLRFTTTSIATVGVLLGVLFLLAALNEFMISAVKQSWRWGHILLGIFFVVGAIWAFARPFDAFWSIASVLGFLLILKGTLDIITAFMTREVNSSWWLGLVVGILELVLGFWTSQQLFPARGALLLLWVGFFALFRGISEIVIAFEVRSRQHA